MSTFINRLLFYLRTLDLTNRREVELFRLALVENGNDLCNYHAETHNDWCDCREHQRLLVLFRVIIQFLDILLNNNNF